MKQAPFILMLILVACQRMDNSYSKIRQLIGNEQLLKDRPNVIILSENQCKGCVQDKITEFISEAPSAKKESVLVILDTLRNPSFPYVKENLFYLHVPQRKIEETYPVIVNFMLIRTRPGKVIFERDFTSTGDTSHLINYF